LFCILFSIAKGTASNLILWFALHGEEKEGMVV